MEIETILRRLLIGLFCFLTSLSIASAYKSGESHMSHFNTGIQDRVSSEAMFHNYFVDKGFMNGKIKIPELAVEVNLGKNQFFKKEEKVADLCVRIKEIRKQFGLSNHDSDCVQGYGWCGFLQAECQGEEAYGYVILIKKEDIFYATAEIKKSFIKDSKIQILFKNKFIQTVNLLFYADGLL